MTTPELVEKLKVVADMGDKQIEGFANILIEYFDSQSKKKIGFKK